MSGCKSHCSLMASSLGGGKVKGVDVTFSSLESPIIVHLECGRQIAVSRDLNLALRHSDQIWVPLVALPQCD